MPAESGSHPRRRQTDGGFVLDMRSLGRAPGSMRELHRMVTVPEKIGLDLVGIPAGAELELDLVFQSVSEGVLVTGTVAGTLEGECSRCLESFSDEIELQLTELFAYPNSATEQTTEEDEIHRLVDDMVDLEPVVVDAVGLELPLQPLCEPDCPGLCPECGVRMAIAGSDHKHEILDPRWAGLANFAADTAAESDVDRSLAGRSGSTSSTTEES
ncbi:YceD family protein [Nocardia sp. NPDC051570]|uniref:YceD family protein n=1 Tax=Nocardia sp. NPDC051570 TaxID=3364324 RepID=UPI00379CDB85